MILLLYCSDYAVARFGSKRKEFPPLGVLYLAAACEKNGIEVQVKDLATLKDEDIPFAHIIGLSINTSYVYPIFKDRIDTLRVKCDFLIAGGQHVTIFPQETFADLKVDYILVGEGELSLPMLIQRLQQDNNPKINDIPAVFCSENISVARYSELNRIQDLDSIPFPARHLLDTSEILLTRRIPGFDVYSTNIITARGCPYNCRFCGNIYKGFRFRSIQNVRKEIECILNYYPAIQGLVFMDENLFFQKDHALQVISCMSQYDLKWTCNARIDGFSNAIISSLRYQNCVEIKYGVESGSQRMLNLMNKGITINDIESTLKNTVMNGIRTKCFLMYGYPGDNLQSATETINFLHRNKKNIMRVNLFSFAPVPNSPIYRSGICRNYSWNDYKIYNQLLHWWGDEKQYLEMKRGYQLLQQYVADNYPETE